MKHVNALATILLLLGAPDAFADQPATSSGELALVEIVSWSVSQREPGGDDHTGFLHAKRIESTGTSLPPTFRLFFRRSLSGGAGATDWNHLPSHSGGLLKIHNGEWLIGRFVRSGDAWEVLPGQREFALSRPEDLRPERLRIVQSQFVTPLIRTWVPSGDVLADVLARVQWRMTESEFREAFKRDSCTEGQWILTRHSFRKTITVQRPNTDVQFEFSGVVDNEATELSARSSSLISLRVKHPLQRHPQAGFVRPPESRHHRYLKQLHDACAARFDAAGIDYEHEEMFHSRGPQGYLQWERIIADAAGSLTFVYWSTTGDEGVLAAAPPTLIAMDRKQELAAAVEATKDWPISVCGNEADEDAAGVQRPPASASPATEPPDAPRP